MAETTWKTIGGNLQILEHADGSVDMRHKENHDNVLYFTSDEWEAFRKGAKGGEFSV